MMEIFWHLIRIDLPNYVVFIYLHRRSDKYADPVTNWWSLRQGKWPDVVYYKWSLQRKRVQFISASCLPQKSDLSLRESTMAAEQLLYLFCRLLRLFGLQGIVLDNITLFAPCIVAPIKLSFRQYRTWTANSDNCLYSWIAHQLHIGTSLWGPHN